MIPHALCERVLSARVTVFRSERRTFQPAQQLAPTVVPTARLLLIEQGGAEYHIDGRQLTLSPGQVLLVPAMARRWWQARGGPPFTMSWVEFMFTARAAIDPPAVQLSLAPGAFREALGVYRHIEDAGVIGGQRERLLQEAELRVLLTRVLLHPLAESLSLADAGGAGDDAVRAALAWLERHYATPTPERGLATRVGLSDNHFRLRFRASVGFNPRAFVLELRLHAARQLLAAGSLGVKQVAAAVGYRDPLLFSRLYRRRWGMPPSRDA